MTQINTTSVRKDLGEWETFTTLCLSTSHLDKQNRESLDELQQANNAPITVAEYDCGWFVYVLPENCTSLLEEIQSTWFTSTFWPIYELAQRLGCRYIQFDSDGPVHSDLPEFDDIGERNYPDKLDGVREGNVGYTQLFHYAEKQGIGWNAANHLFFGTIVEYKGHSSWCLLELLEYANGVPDDLDGYVQARAFWKEYKPTVGISLAYELLAKYMVENNLDKVVVMG